MHIFQDKTHISADQSRLTGKYTYTHTCAYICILHTRHKRLNLRRLADRYAYIHKYVYIYIYIYIHICILFTQNKRLYLRPLYGLFRVDAGTHACFSRYTANCSFEMEIGLTLYICMCVPCKHTNVCP
jgi:hypothetical protein